MAWAATLATLRDRIWAGRLPLEIRLSPAECRTYDRSDPFLVGGLALSVLPHNPPPPFLLSFLSI